MDTRALLATTQDRFDEALAGASLPPLIIPRNARRGWDATDAWAHVHAFPEFYLQLRGVSLLHGPGGVTRVKAGAFCLIPPQYPHFELCGKLRGETFAHVLFSLGPASAGFHYADADGERPHIRARQSLPNAGSRHIAEHFRELLQARDPSCGAAHHLYAHLLTELRDLVAESAGQSVAEDETEHPKVRYCKALIESNLSRTDLTVRLLAEWIHCSPDYLSHLFHQETGTPIRLWIQQARLALARPLLADARYNITETARACGFADPAYFARVFRQTTGVTPRDYRRQMQ